MISYVMVLHLTVTDCDTGKTLFQAQEEMSPGMDHCRQIGVENAEILTKIFRGQYPNASTNIVCSLKQKEPTI